MALTLGRPLNGLRERGHSVSLARRRQKRGVDAQLFNPQRRSGDLRRKSSAAPKVTVRCTSRA